jgi:hypothetical protein
MRKLVRLKERRTMWPVRLAAWAVAVAAAVRAVARNGRTLTSLPALVRQLLESPGCVGLELIEGGARRLSMVGTVFFVFSRVAEATRGPGFRGVKGDQHRRRLRLVLACGDRVLVRRPRLGRSGCKPNRDASAEATTRSHETPVPLG